MGTQLQKKENLSTIVKAADCYWRKEVVAAGKYKQLHMDSFDPIAPLLDRLIWASESGVPLGSIYTRGDAGAAEPVADSIRTCLSAAAMRNVYVPPELICVSIAAGAKKRKLPRPAPSNRQARHGQGAVH